MVVSSFDPIIAVIGKRWHKPVKDSEMYSSLLGQKSSNKHIN